tara:strand:- start:208 stop:1113 length:906 start_codon:yes stop_codon:yes gene_type:complete
MNFFEKSKKNNKSKKKFLKLNCHPKNKTSKNSLSCFDVDTVFLLKDMWNKRHPDKKILKRNKNIIWRELKKYMSDSCNHEMCWIDKTIDSESTKEKLKNELFVPTMPKSWKENPSEWLSSVEISDVMKQYEDKYDDFLFIGPSPIDFDSVNTYNTTSKEICVWPELCNFNISEHINNNIKKFGFIFNTDKHYKGGSHWISMYLDLKKKVLFFFDSAGNKPPRQIVKLIDKIISQCKDNNKHIRQDTNYPKVHQRRNTECGMYCLYFIISILQKKHNTNYFKKKRIEDNLVQKFRSIYFNNL